MFPVVQAEVWLLVGWEEGSGPRMLWSLAQNLLQVLPLFPPAIASSQKLSNTPGQEEEFKENLN